MWQRCKIQSLMSINEMLLEYSYTHSLCLLWLFLHKAELNICNKDHLAGPQSLKCLLSGSSQRVCNPLFRQEGRKQVTKERSTRVVWGLETEETTSDGEYQKRCSFLEKVKWLDNRQGWKRHSPLHTREVGEHYIFGQDEKSTLSERQF